MEESDGTMSSDDQRNKLTPSVKVKPKKRSLVERELETSLTEQFISPINNGDVSSKSRYGRARKLKTDASFCDTDKAVAQALKSPKLEKTPVKTNSPAYKMHASNTPVTESPKRMEGIENQIENIYNANISLSRFSEEKKSPSPAKKFPKVYIRTDLIQTKEKEDDVKLIKNIFPNSSYKSTNSHLNNILERSSEKYNINGNSNAKHNGHIGNTSVVKILDFDSNKRKKKENKDTSKVLSKNELFEMEAKSFYQVGDLAWARVGTYPFWPCIVTREPSSDMFMKKKLFGRVEHDIIHVTFFGDNGRRSWIVDNMLRPFLGLQEFENTKNQFTPEAKKKDPRLYAAFFISEKKQALWKMSVEEAESLMREPKRLRIDIFYEMLGQSKTKVPPKGQKSEKITRTDSDVSLSESLLDTLFSEDDGKTDDLDKSRNKPRNMSLDVSEVVTACLDNMAAKTGITKIQRQSHMDRWLQKAKSKTPEKNQIKITLSVERIDKDKDAPKQKDKEVKNSDSKKKKKIVPRETVHIPSSYSFRKSIRESHTLVSNQNEHEDKDEGKNIDLNGAKSGSIPELICTIDKVESLKETINENNNEAYTKNKTKGIISTQDNTGNNKHSEIEVPSVFKVNNDNNSDFNKKREDKNSDEILENNVESDPENKTSNASDDCVENVSAGKEILNTDARKNNATTDEVTERTVVDVSAEHTEINEILETNTKRPSDNAIDLTNEKILENIDRCINVPKATENSKEVLTNGGDTLNTNVDQEVVFQNCEETANNAVKKDVLVNASEEKMDIDEPMCEDFINCAADKLENLDNLSPNLENHVENQDKSHKSNGVVDLSKEVLTEDSKIKSSVEVESKKVFHKIVNSEVSLKIIEQKLTNEDCESSKFPLVVVVPLGKEIALLAEKDKQIDSAADKKTSTDDELTDCESVITFCSDTKKDSTHNEIVEEVDLDVNNDDIFLTLANGQDTTLPDSIPDETKKDCTHNKIVEDDVSETLANRHDTKLLSTMSNETKKDSTHNEIVEDVDMDVNNDDRFETLANVHETTLSDTISNETKKDCTHNKIVEIVGMDVNNDDGSETLGNGHETTLPGSISNETNTSDSKQNDETEHHEISLVDKHYPIQDTPKSDTIDNGSREINETTNNGQTEITENGYDDEYSDDDDDDIEQPPYSPHCPQSEQKDCPIVENLEINQKDNAVVENFELSQKDYPVVEDLEKRQKDCPDAENLEISQKGFDSETISVNSLTSETSTNLDQPQIVKVMSLSIPKLENKYVNDIKKDFESDSDSMSSELDNMTLSELKKALKAKKIRRRPESPKDSKTTDTDTEVLSKRELRSRISKSPSSSIKENGFLSSKDPSPERKSAQEFDTISINSEDSNASVSKRKTRKERQPSVDNMQNPEFLKYLELRQDNLIDEHPELTHDEIVHYLYKTWLYEESNKSERMKTEDMESSQMVKGVANQGSQPKKTKTVKRRRVVDIVKVMEKMDDFKPREKRKTVQPLYTEDFSDLEDEIEVFEIFKTKSKVKVESNKVETQKAPAEEIKTEVKIIEKTEQKATLEIVQVPLDEEEKVEEVYFDQEEAYFEQLTKPKPNVFKGIVREKVCEICEKTTNLVKCKGCHGMFHIECVNKKVVEEEVPQSTRGRKKRKRGRKSKASLDSNGHDSGSDDKSQDPNVSEELNISNENVTEPEPLVVDLDSLETQLEAKMKELVESNKVDYESYSSDDGIDWEKTVAGKCEIVEIKLKPKPVQTEVDYSDFKCKNCIENDVPICFVCKSAVSPKGGSERQKCQVAHCHKYYHLSCLDHWPQTQFNAGEPSRNNKKINEHFEALTCPRHVCHTCVCDDPRGCKTRFSGDKLARCVRCPATYHSFTKCLPAGTKILTASHIICPRHYEHRPGKVPCHVNTGWCFICALGGSLICCEYCPTSFHADCLNIEPPEGGYMCEDCETGRLPLYGEMVWVKLGHYRWWPGIILHPSEIPDNIMAVKHSLGEFVVRFFGQYDHYWVNRGRVFPFQEGDSGRISGQKSKIDEAFIKAMEHAQRAFDILKNVEPSEEDPEIASSLLPPHYVKLKVNKPCGSLCGKRIDIEESSLTQCECNPDEEEPCGPYSHCLNRMLLTECGPMCRSGERCCNRAFEKRQYPKLTPYRTPHRGWGLKTLEDIKAGQFVIEYVGELIDEEEFRRRMSRKHEIRDENFYFLTLDKERMIDAGPKGNLARFMNHCCEPNCETQKWTVLGDVRVGLFALKDIPANSEVTFNYNLECAGIEKKRCLCGAKRCSGYIGAKPKQEETQPKKPKDKIPVKRTYKKRKQEDSPSTSKVKPKRPVGRPAKPRELTEIEKDLLIIKQATNLSSDSEGSGRLSSADIVSSTETDERNVKALKRKRVSFSTEEVIIYDNNSKVKKIKLDEEKNEIGD